MAAADVCTINIIVKPIFSVNRLVDRCTVWNSTNTYAHPAYRDSSSMSGAKTPRWHFGLAQERKLRQQ